ncbi:thiamine pyrophosphate-requiring protein [Mesorhizobium sp. J428]|uniref:thiamine pyrophosphate-requiring protein n=1 Tax=Mesorhizobium sp. J428 TaxID=2898440 RepID=UPI002150ECEE|nr:thiamine pyrophosphate-requiring protein [Mesorhizobium sp. J428]MCR5856330.1 thiamine pyrophosphate-requiring protein [Mesorhizobium sp. J428]
MRLGEAIAEILKREGVELICGYPVNHVLERAAEADIRPVIVRQERTGIHMADAISRLSSGRRIGVFAMQLGPGTENSYGGIAQAYSESVPLLVLPMGYERRLAHIDPNYNATISMKGITKSTEPITSAAQLTNVFRRAFSRLRNGRGGPVLIEIPNDMWQLEVPEPLDYRPVLATRYGPDPAAVAEAVDLLLAARCPVLYAGQGVHYARAWPQLKALAERLAIPVSTSLEGKSAFPETHALSIGAGGAAISKTLRHFLDASDVIFGIGCSFTETAFGVQMPLAKTIIHATLDPDHINKDVEARVALVGDAGLTLDAVIAELDARGTPVRDAAETAAEIGSVQAAWLAEWMPKLTSNDAPLSPYRVLWDLQHTVDVANTIITHDAGSPRDQLSPFWKTIEPLTYIGWGKSTQLGYGLGLAMGAKLAHPDKLCINVWGDAAIGFTGMDFETAVRERIPILSILLNNFSMAMELPIMPVSTEKYRSTDISGDYAAFARAMGAYGERVTTPEEIVPAILRGIEKTKEGVPVLLEFITSKEIQRSRYHRAAAGA